MQARMFGRQFGTRNVLYLVYQSLKLLKLLSKSITFSAEVSSLCIYVYVYPHSNMLLKDFKGLKGYEAFRNSNFQLYGVTTSDYWMLLQPRADREVDFCPGTQLCLKLCQKDQCRLMLLLITGFEMKK